MFVVISVFPPAHSAHLKVLDSLKSKVLDYVDWSNMSHVNFFNCSLQFFQQKRKVAAFSDHWQVYGFKPSAKTVKSQEVQKREAALKLTYLCLSPSTLSPCRPWAVTAPSSSPSHTEYVLFSTQCVGHKFKTKMLTLKFLNSEPCTGQGNHSIETQKLQDRYTWCFHKKHLSISSTQPTGMVEKVMLH